MKRSGFVKPLMGFVTAILLLALAGCGSSAQQNASQQDASLQKVLDAGQLVIGIETGFPPSSFIDDSGENVGFDIDMAQEVCDRLGIRLVKHPIDWENKVDTLYNGEIDCIWSAMSYTPSRAQVMDLSDPYMQSGVIFLVSRDNGVRSSQDLRGQTVGVQHGTKGEEILKESDLWQDITPVYGDNLEIIQQLLDGKLDAVLTDSTIAYYFINQGCERFYVLSDSLSEDEYVIGFRKSDPALRNRIQEVVNEMAADGTLAEISNKWFGCDITIVR